MRGLELFGADRVGVEDRVFPRVRELQESPEDALKWVDPDHSDLGGLEFKTFHSGTIKADVSYMIYLPPDYGQDKDTRYPVLYQLPASGGTPRRDGPQVTFRIDKAIRAKRIGPMIVVAVNGLAGNTMYADTRDGQYPLETVIIKDLIPHIDATYRTIASREGRGVNGFSMGGFGAAHLGFKYPDVFGFDSIMAPPLVEPGLTGLPAQAWGRLFPTAMDGDMEYWKTNNPFDLAVKNAGSRLIRPRETRLLRPWARTTHNLSAIRPGSVRRYSPAREIPTWCCWRKLSLPVATNPRVPASACCIAE